MSHTDPPPPQGPARQPPPPPQAPAGDDNPQVAHEHSDINVRALMSFAVGLVVVMAGVFVLMAWMFNIMRDRAAATDPIVSPLARPATQMPKTTAGNPFFGNAPGPQLLIEEPAALKKQRGMEDDKLETYGWIDEKAGTARMPLSEAKKLLLQRGLPVRADGAPDPSLGTRLPAAGESSGGRILGKKKEEATGHGQ